MISDYILLKKQKNLY